MKKYLSLIIVLIIVLFGLYLAYSISNDRAVPGTENYEPKVNSINEEPNVKPVGYPEYTNGKG